MYGARTKTGRKWWSWGLIKWRIMGQRQVDETTTMRAWEMFRRSLTHDLPGILVE